MLQNDELVIRAALLPRMVVSGVISPAKVVSDLQGQIRDDGVKIYTLSLGSSTLLVTQADKHSYGCRVATKTNEYTMAKAAEVGAVFEQTFYRGHFSMTVQGIHGASTTLFTLEVHMRPLDGLPEHCDIEMCRTGTAATKGEVSSDRTRIIARLRALLHDPQEHICPADLAQAAMIQSIRLVA